MKPLIRALPVALLLVAPPSSRAQSLNVDFGSAAVPSSAYGGASLSGVWNAIDVLPATQRAPLVGLDGSPVAAKIYMIGGTDLLESDDPTTSGDHEALIDDMLIGFNDPVDVCVWFEDLQNGDYDVVLYGLTPKVPALMSRVRVDFATPGPIEIGGAWPGQHQDGVSYATFRVTVTDGTIGLHSGLWAATVQSGLNGIQVVDVSAATSASARNGRAGSSILGISPNPAFATQRIRLAIGEPRPEWLEIVDVTGRLVWRHDLRALPVGARQLSWDGRGLAGAPVPAAVYFVRLRGGEAPAHEAVKLVRVR